MDSDALEMLAQEARALLTRLMRVKPFAGYTTEQGQYGLDAQLRFRRPRVG